MKSIEHAWKKKLEGIEKEHARHHTDASRLSITGQLPSTSNVLWSRGYCRNLIVPSVRSAMRASFTRRAPGVTLTTSIVRRVPAALRWRAPAVTPVSVATIMVTILASITSRVTVTVPAVISTAIVVTTTRATMSHIFTRSCCMGAVGYGIVDTDSTTIEFLFSLNQCSLNECRHSRYRSAPEHTW